MHVTPFHELRARASQASHSHLSPDLTTPFLQPRPCLVSACITCYPNHPPPPDPPHTNTKHVFLQKHLTQQAHKHNIYVPSKSLTTPHSSKHNICSFKTYHNISNMPRIIAVRNILCYSNRKCRTSFFTSKQPMSVDLLY